MKQKNCPIFRFAKQTFFRGYKSDFSVQNHQQLANPTPVSEHFNLPGHSVNDIRLIPLELIHTNRDSVRKAREAHLIDKAKTLEPQGLNRRDELH